jgi:TM2 domain-containing membrane protein YozV
MGGSRYAVGKTPALALFLSFLIPGIGQFHNGDSKKGGIIVGCWLLSWLLIGTAGVGFFTGAGVWIWSMVDAYRVASGKTPMWS